MKQYHDGFCGGHYAIDYTAKKILHAGYYWQTLFKDVTLHCKTCEFYQFFGRKDLHPGQHHPVIFIVILLGGYCLYGEALGTITF